MAIVGIGVDVVDLARFANLVERTPQIVDRLFTKAEQVSAEGHQLSVMSLAGRFAVKEAVAKALGVTNWHVSLSHDGPVAIAYVIAERV